MKKIIILTGILISGFTFSQVSIGKESVDGKGILDFGTDGNKGIILPIVDITDPSQIYTDGTILMDKDDLTVKVRQDGNWLLLSDPGSLQEQVDENNIPITTAAVINTSGEIGNGVIIGDVDTSGNPVSGAQGVLVLEATDKALILPKVANPHIEIKSPVAGTICYDTASDSLAVFDGKVWNYWK